MKQVFFLFVLAFAFTQYYGVGAVPFEITLYNEDNYTGKNVTLTETDLNFTNTTLSFGGKVGSFCFVGIWRILSDLGGYIYIPTTDTFCSGIAEKFERVREVIRMGPADTKIPSIAMYDSDGFGKDVVIIEDRDEATLNISTDVLGNYWAFTSGNSDWTIFENNNFQGKSACVQSDGEMDYQTLYSYGLTSIGSVKRNCNSTNI